MKNALIVLSDPKTGSEEATTRLLNALAFAGECKRSGDDLAIIFAGTGTRWPIELYKTSHPAHGFYREVHEHVLGASHACAMLSDATAGLAAIGLPLLSENLLAGTPGTASLRGLQRDGWTVTVF